MIALSHPAFARSNRKPALHRLLLTLEEGQSAGGSAAPCWPWAIMRSRTSASAPLMPGGKAASQPGNGDQDAPLPLSFGAHAMNNKGTYVLTCELPPFSGAGAVGASHIITYNVVEE